MVHLHFTSTRAMAPFKSVGMTAPHPLCLSFPSMRSTPPLDEMVSIPHIPCLPHMEFSCRNLRVSVCYAPSSPFRLRPTGPPFSVPSRNVFPDILHPPTSLTWSHSFLRYIARPHCPSLCHAHFLQLTGSLTIHISFFTSCRADLALTSLASQGLSVHHVHTRF